METIQARLELQGGCVRVRVRTWPDGRDLLRARLAASPGHPRAALELLEAVARWEGRAVHAAVIVDESACCVPTGLFPDLLPEASPLVACDYVAHRAKLYRERSALHLRGGGRDRQCELFPAAARRAR